MLCPSCQKQNPDGARFCNACGVTLDAACPGCGHANPAGSRFCTECGFSLLPSSSPVREQRFASPGSYTPPHLAEKILTSRSALEGERKQVTVLFCDIANSTGLAERIGPEPMHTLLNRFFEVAAAEIHRYEGTVNQFLGDGFMALFGAPLAHEDHARRAVLAALGIQRRLHEREADLGGPEEGFKLRLGLNTGPVVVGKIGDNLRMDYTAVGDTTNLAARLQQHAEPGTVLISEATSRLVKGYVRLEPLAPVAVKGKREPVAAFKVIGLGIRRSPLEHRDRPLSPFVGRERELAALREALADAEAGRSQVVGIVGEAGAGKSRLLYEFRRSLDGRRVTYLEGRCLSYGSAMPYLPLQDIIRDNCGITDTDTPAEVGDKIRAALAQVDMNADEAAPYLLQLLGVKEGTERLAQIGPETIRARIFGTLRELTVRGTRRRPLVVAIEDLHWVDKTSEEYFTEVGEAVAGAPVVLLTTYRPGYRPPWLDKSYATQIALRPLSPDDSLSVVQSTVQRADLAPGVAEMVVGKAEGNPFFLEELTRAVVEQGQTDPAAVLPETIQGVLLARIDRLPDEPKRVLQTAAVLGREFSVRLLEAVCRDCGNVLPHLHLLKRLEFLYERAGAAEVVYVFKHALTQEVAYVSLLSGRRETLHEAAGQALETLHADRLEERYEQLAHHYARSPNREKALQYLDLANRKAATANAMEEAKACFQAAMAILNIVPETDAIRQQRVQLVVNQLLVFWLLFRLSEYYDILMRYQPLAAALGDPGLRGAFYARVGACEWGFGQYDKSIETLMEAARLCEEAGTPDEAAFVSIGLQWNYLLKGDWDEVIRWEAPALRKLEEQFHLRWYVWALCGSSQAYASSGRWDAAEETATRALRRAEEFSDESLVTFAAWILAVAYLWKGDIRRATEWGELSVRTAPTPADRAWAQTNLARVWCRGGEPQRAAATCRELLEAYRSTGYLVGEVWTGVVLGEAYWLSGEFENASDVLQEVLDLTQRSGAKFFYGSAHRVLGEASACLGDPGQAAQRFEQSIEILGRIKSENELALAYAGYGRLHRGQGRIAEARDYLTRALVIFERLGTLAEPDRVRSELRELTAG